MIGCGLVGFECLTVHCKNAIQIFQIGLFYNRIAIWMLPRHNAYGTWPASGEIDLVESRGNLRLMQNGVNIGVEQAGQTLHW